MSRAEEIDLQLKRLVREMLADGADRRDAIYYLLIERAELLRAPIRKRNSKRVKVVRRV